MKICWITDIDNARLHKWNFGDISNELNNLKLAQNIHVRVGTSECVQRAKESDVIIFYRCRSDQFDLINTLHAMKKIVGYCIDDYLWDKNEVSYVPVLADRIKTYFQKSNFLIFTNEYMAKLCNLDRPKIIKSTAIYPEMLLQFKKNKKDEEKLNLVLTKDHVTPWLADYIKEVLMLCDKTKFARDINFHYFGGKYIFNAKNIVTYKHRPNYDMDIFYEKIHGYKPDILLNINPETPFMHCKGMIKYFESGMFEAPLLTTRLYGMEVIKDKENGLLASTPQEFVKKITWAYKNRELLAGMGLSAREEILKNHTVEIRAKKFFEDLNKIVMGIKYNSEPIKPEGFKAIVNSPSKTREVPKKSSPSIVPIRLNQNLKRGYYQNRDLNHVKVSLNNKLMPPKSTIIPIKKK